MTDKEIIQGRIDELENNIRKGRSTGKTYRAINAAIEELFNKPIGSQIHLIDDEYTMKNPILLKQFANKFAQRMQRDFPETYFKIIYPAPGVAIAVITSETYQEIANKRLAQWKQKLEEMN